MDQKIIQAAVMSFGIDIDTPIKLLRESADNAVFIVGGNNKKVLRISKRLPMEDIAFEYEAVNSLAERGALVPRFLPAQSGEYYAASEGVVAVLFNFIEGHHVEVDKDHLPSLQQAFEAGKGLARIHNVGRNLALSSPRRRTIFSELERALSLEDIFIERLEGGKDFIGEVRVAIEFGKSHLEDVGFIHNDYRPGNVFFDDADHLAGIIDFDWSCVAPIAKDVAHGALEWSFPDAAIESDVKVFDSFLEGYNSIANRKQVRSPALYDWIAFAALSDVATYFCDRIREPSAPKGVGSSYMYRKFQFFN